MTCPQCGSTMTRNGAIDTPPIEWQLRGFTGDFQAERWCCLSCFELFDYAPSGVLYGRVTPMRYAPPIAVLTRTSP
jgi:hypothetical protein